MSAMESLKGLVAKLNEYGVPLPMARVDGKPSMTATMAIMSFTTALLGQIGKVTHFIGDVDLTQANYLFGITLAAYLGRKYQTNAAEKTANIESGEQK